MSVPGIEAVATTGIYQPAIPSSGSTDKDMFLQLMVAQLRYQDPMNPADSGEFLAQNAQFTALEKMQDVADQTAALLAAQVSFGATGLVGKNVTYLQEDGKSVSGLVRSVTFDEAGPTLVVDGKKVTLGQIQSVDAMPATPPAPATPATTTP